MLPLAGGKSARGERDVSAAAIRPRQSPWRISPDRIRLLVRATNCWPDAYSRYRFTRDLSAARNVVSDEEKPTIWLESGARVSWRRVHMFRPGVAVRPHSFLLMWFLRMRATLSRTPLHVAERGFGHVDSVACCNRIPCRAARRGGTFHFHHRSRPASPSRVQSQESRCREFCT